MISVNCSAPDAPPTATVRHDLAVDSRPQGREFPAAAVSETPVKSIASVAYNVDSIVDTLLEEMKRCERTVTIAA